MPNKLIDSQRAVVIAANMVYSEQVMTLVKSICFHNDKIKIYLMNIDFPPEWFIGLNQRLEKVNCEIVDVKFNNERTKHFPSLSHINTDATYYRYFIPEYIPEDKVLYLDADIIINGNIHCIWDIDITNYHLAATTDYISEVLHNAPKSYFNAGVLLINNKRWREEKVTDALLYGTEKYLERSANYDQDVLNALFQNDCLHLNRFFNYQVGSDYAFAFHQVENPPVDTSERIPSIIHYNTRAKPWNLYYPTRYRELWWHYFYAEWNEIIAHYQQNQSFI